MNIVTIPVGFLATNCYILASEKMNCAVIDPGAAPEKILERISREKLNVAYVLLTHGHHDHIGGVKRLMEQFPAAKLLIGRNDREMLTDTNKSNAAIRHPGKTEFLLDNAGGVSDGEELTLDELTIKVLETPGHTRGGVCYICGEQMFSGDTLFYEEVGRCDLYGGDYLTMLSSLRKLCALPGDYRVYPGHGPGSSLEHERHNNQYIADAMKRKAAE